MDMNAVEGYDSGLFANTEAIQMPPYECEDPDITFYLVKDAHMALEVSAKDQRENDHDHFGVYQGTSVVVSTADATAGRQLLDAGLRRFLCDENAEEYLGTDQEKSPIDGCIFVDSLSDNAA